MYEIDEIESIQPMTEEESFSSVPSPRRYARFGERVATRVPFKPIANSERQNDGVRTFQSATHELPFLAIGNPFVGTPFGEAARLLTDGTSSDPLCDPARLAVNCRAEGVSYSVVSTTLPLATGEEPRTTLISAVLLSRLSPPRSSTPLLVEP